MKATCPNSPNHLRFITTAHVAQEWVVDESGNFIEESDGCSQVTHWPDIANTWTCKDCGAEAKVEGTNY